MSVAVDPVPFFDWRALFAERAEDYVRVYRDTAATGGFILQAAVDEFEHGLADYVGVKHVIGLSDCTNAMLLGLRALDLAPGDEVILPAHAFIAAAQAIHFAGATPVPVDLREEDWLVDPDAIAAAITSRTRAIMAVHVNGRVCDMPAIEQIADRHGLIVVEDAAQALGAKYLGRQAGSFGRWGAYSFYPSKTLGCFGDAGALVTNDDDIARRVRAMRNHGAGSDKVIPRDCTVWATNSRIDNLHAATLVSKLQWYDLAIARRRAIAQRYHDALCHIAALDLPSPPDADPDHFDIFQNYELCCDERDALRTHLDQHGIGTIVQWGGCALSHFTALGMGRDLSRTDRFFARALLLPMNHMLSDEAVDRVIGAVESFYS